MYNVCPFLTHITVDIVGEYSVVLRDIMEECWGIFSKSNLDWNGVTFRWLRGDLIEVYEQEYWSKVYCLSGRSSTLLTCSQCNAAFCCNTCSSSDPLHFSRVNRITVFQANAYLFLKEQYIIHLVSNLCWKLSSDQT